MLPSWRASAWWPWADLRVKFKVDENLPVELAELLRSSGHEADTVADEHASGAVARIWRRFASANTEA
jgi:uncharacterized protein DUF5615